MSGQGSRVPVAASDAATVADRAGSIGFVGVGHMGRHMAASLARAGFRVTVHDTRPDARADPVLAGVEWAESPRGVAERSGVTVMSLPGPPQVEEVVLGPSGLLTGALPGDCLIDMSTSTPESIRRIAAEAAVKAVAVLDAPVAGGVRGARKGTLTIMVGGPRETFDKHLPILEAMGERIYWVGGQGAGHVAKLVNNMMTIVNGLAAMEAMVVGVKAGVSPSKLLEVARAGTGDSFALNVFPYVIFKRAFDPKFALGLAAKDLRVAVAYADELGVPVSVVRNGLEALDLAIERGLGERDWTSYITLLEQAASVEVSADE
jgi:3-hydroxyisobutyrate dehydrogenase-like beta-hydroxyacid dehydrogenase